MPALSRSADSGHQALEPVEMADGSHRLHALRRTQNYRGKEVTELESGQKILDYLTRNWKSEPTDGDGPVMVDLRKRPN